MTEERLCLAQMETFQRIGRFLENTKKQRVASWTSVEFEDRLTLLETIWSQFLQRHNDLCGYFKEMEDNDYFKLDIRSEAENAYISTRSWLHNQLLPFPVPSPRNPLLPVTTSPVRVRPDHSHLKPIPLPKFMEKQEEWVSFKERFQALVLDDDTMPEVIKLERLIAQLEGEALGKYREVEVTGHNLDLVWNALIQRFDNFHLQLSQAVRAITRIPEATKETEEHLNLIATVLAQSTATFSSLKLDIKTWDPILIASVKDKLAASTHALWIDRLADQYPNSAAPLSEFKNFVERRLRARDRLEGKPSTGAVAGKAKTS